MNFLQVTLDFSKEAAGTLPGVTAQSASSPQAGFGIFLSGIFSAIMVVGILLVLLFLLWGAIEWITSGGDKSKTENARNKITTSIIGMIVLASTVALFGVLQTFLGIEVLRFRSGSAIQDALRSGSGAKSRTLDSGLNEQLDQDLIDRLNAL